MATAGELLDTVWHRGRTQKSRLGGQQHIHGARPVQCCRGNAGREQGSKRRRQLGSSYEGHELNDKLVTVDRGSRPNSLWDSIADSGRPIAGALYGPTSSVSLGDLDRGSIFSGKLEALRGRCVVLATHAQLPTAIALVELDGVAARVVLCTPDLSAEQLAVVAATAAADVIVVDDATSESLRTSAEVWQVTPAPTAVAMDRRTTCATEWVLLTSGTTGSPKLVVHSFDSLAGALPRTPTSVRPMVWSTFYDIRRFGGLQIYLRALCSGSPLVLSSTGEAVKDFFSRAGGKNLTHISGTPSHWRRALMSGEAGRISPEYVRLSGEVADQAILDNLKAAFPEARVAHAFASTEAGVAFDVNDGLAGFPVEFIEKARGNELAVRNGTLWIRSSRTAARYLGEAPAPIASADGFVDTGDMIERVDDRYYFRGRRGGIINVGGLKVYPEEVEAILNADPRVRMSLVKSRRNPITGAVIIADVVLTDRMDDAAAENVKHELLAACRSELAAHKVPALLRFVPTLVINAAGKVIRPNA